MKTKLCLLAALAISLSSLVGCQKIEARMEIKEANNAYGKEDYKVALSHYRKAQQIDSKSFPELERMIGYSLIGTFSPEDKSPENQRVADQAVTSLLSYLQKRPDDAIARDALVNLYLNADRTTDAINYFKRELQKQPNNLDFVRSIAQLLAKQGDFNGALDWYEKVTLIDSKNPEAFYVFGVVCYEKVAKNPPADMADRVRIIEKGKAALQHSIDMKTDYSESMAYLNLLYRQQALIETDPVKQQEFIAKADEIRGRAIEIIKKKKAAAAPAAPAPAQS